LTCEEYKVLIYATRRILGFQKRQDRISISQFTDGTKNRDGETLDGGTGLGIGTVKKCLANLVDFGLMVRLQENDPRTNEGTLWSLQWDSDKVNWQALEERAEQIDKMNAERIAKARSVRQTPPATQTGVSGTERTPASPTDPPPASGTETQKTEETQGYTDIKERILKLLQSVSFSVFKDPREWEPVKRLFEEDRVTMTGDNLRDVADVDNPMQITISGLSRPWSKNPQFTEADIFESRYCQSFANLGLELTFTE
jgi:hypothetical protein